MCSTTPGLTEGGLELKMPDDVDDAYQVYINGTLIGGLGHFSKRGVTSYLTLPRSFASAARHQERPGRDCHSRLDGSSYATLQS